MSSFSLYLTGLLMTAVICLAPVSVAARLLQNESNEEQASPVVATDPLGRDSPRGLVQGFISAVADQNYELAGQYLNVDGLPGELNRAELAQALQRLLDQGDLAPYARISNDSSGVTNDNLPPGVDLVGSLTIGGERVNVLVELHQQPEGGMIWLFSSETLSQLTGVVDDVPLFTDRLLPEVLKENLWGGTPAGHWLIAILLMGISYLLAWSATGLAGFILRRIWRRRNQEKVLGIIDTLTLPVRLYLAVWLFVFLTQQAGISIILRQLFSGLTVVIGIIAILIFLWRLTDFIGSFSKKRMIQRGNASAISIILFLQRAAKTTVIVFGVIAILSVIGIDVTAGLAALGIGGIALALGAQKTMENLVGSVTLVADQPVRVGDFCKVGDIVGTVESIGMRSTRIRTLNRTIVTIPNGEFSSAKIENYAHRDRFLFNPVFNLRYETSPDQIRYLLVEIRSVLYSHPKVIPETARVRFIGFGDASVDLEVYAYINSGNFDDFLEVREDLLLRVMDVIEASGTGFAFPSQTIYFARDGGLSEERSREAEDKVKQWREAGRLQIPSFDPERIRELSNSIAYPPEGSVSRKKDS